MKPYKVSKEHFNSTQLAEIIASNYRIPQKTARKEIAHVFETISQCIENGYGVHVHGFGKFEAYDVDAHEHRTNLNEGTIMVPKRRYVKFRVGRALILKISEGLE